MTISKGLKRNMTPKDTLWELDPQTQGKHLVLEKYLAAWFPIMGSWSRRILFIDGFAGPGQYKGGEPGSPIIALRSLCQHSARTGITSEVGFVFIEKDKDRKDHLESVIDDWKPFLPSNCWVQILQGAFDDKMTEALDQLDTQSSRLAPAFVMVDPFGVSDTPMDVIHRILQNPQAEVYISFMWDFINRFADTSQFGPHLDSLFGCQEWRDCLETVDTDVRRNLLLSLYKHQLKTGGATYVVHFDLCRENRLSYTIFFGTKHLRGCERMKEAIWKIAPWGDFAFHGTHSSQLTLGLSAPDFVPLKEAIREEFSDKGWVYVEEVEEFVASDRTDYLRSHLRKGALLPMYEAGEVEIDESTVKKKRTFPKAARIRIR